MSSKNRQRIVMLGPIMLSFLWSTKSQNHKYYTFHSPNEKIKFFILDMTRPSFNTSDAVIFYNDTLFRGTIECIFQKRTKNYQMICRGPNYNDNSLLYVPEIKLGETIIRDLFCVYTPFKNGYRPSIQAVFNHFLVNMQK